jgi:hypothetical protein
MTRIVRLAHTTRRLHRRWSAAALVFAAGACGLAIAAGGSDLWLRIALGVLALERCRAAIGHRTSLTTLVIAGFLALAMVPVDAGIDRTIVSALGGLLLATAAECAHVARRLATVAPVDETRRDVDALASSIGWAAVAVVILVVVAQLDRWSTRSFTAGAALAAIGVAVLAGSTTWFPRRRPVTDGE